MKECDIEHLNWIYNRLIYVYKEDEYTDFVIKLKDIITELEEMIKTKTCEGCRYNFIPNFILNNVGDKIDICYMCSRQERLDRYEAKDTK